MNYLQLVEFVHREGRFAGTAPTTVSGQSGEALDIVSWVNEAWQDIQVSYDGRWRWLRKRFTLSASASDGTYAYTDAVDDSTGSAIDRFREWRVSDLGNPPKIYNTADGVGGQRYLTFMPWDDFQQIYRFGTQSEGSPIHISVDQDNNLVLGPVPSVAVTVTGEFWRSPQELSVDADEPECPAMYHRAIAYGALGIAGLAHLAPELVERFNVQGMRYINDLHNNQSEVRTQFSLAGPLA